MISALGLTAKNYALTSSCGTYSNSTTTRSDVTNLSQSITVCGQRPILVALVSDGSANQGYVGVYNDTYAVSASAGGELVLLRGANYVSQPIITFNQKTSSDIDVYEKFSPARYLFWDFPSAGTYTYKLQGAANNTGNKFEVKYCKMLVMEVLY